MKTTPHKKPFHHRHRKKIIISSLFIAGLAVTPALILPRHANITAFAVEAKSPTTAVVTVSSDQRVTASVEYGLTGAYGQTTDVNAIPDNRHMIALSWLEPKTEYQLRARTVDAQGNVVYTSGIGFKTPAELGSNETKPPAAIKNLRVASTDATSITLSWDVAFPTADAAQMYDVRYSLLPIVESGFEAAKAVQDISAVYPDLQPKENKRTYVVPGLRSGQTYYFALKSKFQQGAWSRMSNVISGVTTAAAPVDPVSPPKLVQATSADEQNIITWTNPPESSFVRTVLVRKVGSFPKSPIDGDVLYEGTATSFTDVPITNWVTYSYALYSYNRAKVYSTPVLVARQPEHETRQDVFPPPPPEVKPPAKLPAKTSVKAKK